ncbi:MAG: pilus assembly protein PilE, partial [Pseudoxanthomonas sp.]
TCEGVGATFCDNSGRTPTARTSTLTATPTARQDDTLCGRLTINQHGGRTATGTASASPAQCG